MNMSLKIDLSLFFNFNNMKIWDNVKFYNLPNLKWVITWIENFEWNIKYWIWNNGGWWTDKEIYKTI